MSFFKDMVMCLFSYEVERVSPGLTFIEINQLIQKCLVDEKTFHEVIYKFEDQPKLIEDLYKITGFEKPKLHLVKDL